MNLGCYKLIIGSMSDFTRPFQENEQLFKQAKLFWNKLDGLVWIPLVASLILGIIFLYWYYVPYNNRPGRHYKLIHWSKFLGITFIVSLLVSIICLFSMAPSSLQGADVLELKIATTNAFGASFIYLLGSWIWCNFLPTNACRFLKF